MRSLIEWIEDRTGLVSTLRHFLDEDIPASSGWKLPSSPVSWSMVASVALFSASIRTRASTPVAAFANR